MKRITATACAAVALSLAAAAAVVVVPNAEASARPVVTGLSTHRGPYWGGRSVTVTGRNFTDVQQVKFGSAQAWSLQVVSPTRLVVTEPYHGYDTVNVRVFTDAGESSRSAATAFTFAHPSMNDPIQGGMTGHQEQQVSRQVRAHHKSVHLAPKSRHWTSAMGLTAVRRAASYIGVPYSWAGGNGSGPTTGVCAHNGGDVDCHVVGFDCSGLTLYSWWPYVHLDHYAATQHTQAGRFHPTIAQLVPGDLVYFTGYIPGGIGHTAIYEGDGMVIQAPESGHQVERSLLTDVIAGSGGWRGATRPLTTGRTGSGPVVRSVTKQVSAAGGTISVWGRNLAGTTSIRLAGQTVYGFHVASNRHLTMRVPAHSAGTANVSVSNAWGTVKRSFTYVATPTITTLSATSGPTAGANTLTVTGSHLDHVTSVTVGTTSLLVTPTSARSVTFSMPAHAAGAVRVVVHSAFGQSNALVYQYLATSGGTRPRTAPRHITTAPKDSTTPAPTTPAPTSAPTTGPTTGPTTTAPRTAPTTSVPPTAPATSPTTSAPTSPSTSSTGTPPPGAGSSG